MRTLNAFESQQLTAGRLAQQEQLREARCREIDRRRGDDLTEELAALDADIDRQVVTLQNDDAGVLAHELGHALGLLHVAQEPCALMSPDLCTAELTAWDLVEWERTAL